MKFKINYISLLLLTIFLIFSIFCGCVEKANNNGSSHPPTGSPVGGPKISHSKSLESANPKADISKSTEGMIYIPGGVFIFGSGEKYELPKKEVTVASFYIDKYPVTIAEFSRFLKETRYEYKGFERIPPEFKSHDAPMIMVSYHDSAAYAKWAKKRLPTEIEWEMAARGKDGRIFPWGNKWEKTRFMSASKGPHKVGQFPDGASPHGVEDMVGNVFHWTSTPIILGYTDAAPKVRVVKSGGWTYFPRYNRCAFRTIYPEDESSSFIGFRCVKPLDKRKSPIPENQKISVVLEPNNEKFYFDNTLATDYLFSRQLSPNRNISKELKHYFTKSKKGMVVADIGSGIGYLTYCLSPIVRETGKVYAVDVDKSVLEFINVVAREENMKNIVTVHSKPDDISLPPNSCDEIYLVGTVHCLAPPTPKKFFEPFIRSCGRALKKGGRLVVIEQLQPAFPTLHQMVKSISSFGFGESIWKSDKYKIFAVYKKI